MYLAQEVANEVQIDGDEDVGSRLAAETKKSANPNLLTTLFDCSFRPLLSCAKTASAQGWIEDNTGQEALQCFGICVQTIQTVFLCAQQFWSAADFLVITVQYHQCEFLTAVVTIQFLMKPVFVFMKTFTYSISCMFPHRIN